QARSPIARCPPPFPNPRRKRSVPWVRSSGPPIRQSLFVIRATACHHFHRPKGEHMNVLSVMAHQDDELVCLGTMLKMRDRGDRLHFICLTDGSLGISGKPD